jgi:hypothetical protein
MRARAWRSQSSRLHSHSGVAHPDIASSCGHRHRTQTRCDRPTRHTIQYPLYCTQPTSWTTSEHGTERLSQSRDERAQERHAHVDAGTTHPHPMGRGRSRHRPPTRLCHPWLACRLIGSVMCAHTHPVPAAPSSPFSLPYQFGGMATPPTNHSQHANTSTRGACVRTHPRVFSDARL